jgi:alpha-ketoglutarate-dependent 2,4-dichlorophenoxyacetate dioxygenase
MEFADMRAAYDALPDATKQVIGGLVIEHDVFWSPVKTDSPRSPYQGRKTLYLSGHPFHVVDWPVADGRLPRDMRRTTTPETAPLYKVA